MNEAAKVMKAAAEYFGLRFEDVKQALEKLAAQSSQGTKAASHAFESSTTEVTNKQSKVKRGPRVPRNPLLPAVAPELYKLRKSRDELGGRKENIIEFLSRVWTPWLPILSRVELRDRDPGADAAVERWISGGRKLPAGMLPTEHELNTEKRLANQRGARRSRDSAQRMEKI